MISSHILSIITFDYGLAGCLYIFSWIIIRVYLFIERKYKNRTIGAFATPLVFLSLAYALWSPDISDHIQSLLPALKSNWLIAHVMTYFIGYAGFAIAFITSIMYIFQRRHPENTLFSSSAFQR